MFPCIELGAGTGFLSILLAQIGQDVIATDLENGGAERQAPLDRLRQNVALSRFWSNYNTDFRRSRTKGGSARLV